MEKLDLTRKYKTYYTAKNKPELVMIEPARFISISGKGDPSGQTFADHLQALYPVAYAIKFMCKAQNKDFVVAKLEGLWSFDEHKYSGISMTNAPQQIPRSEWSYKMLLRMPDFVTREMMAIAMQTVLKKKQQELVKKVEWTEMMEGRVVQMLHTGPFANEPETLAHMLQFIQMHNLQRNGLHHEIYLSDFRRTPPEKLRTILREPVK
jgi:hypothetical protein